MNKRIIIQDLISDTGQVGNVTVIGDDTPGPTPTGTISITENGTYDVAEFSEAEVEVPTGGGADNLELLLDDQLTSYEIKSSNVKESTFYLASNLTEVIFPAELTQIGNSAFYGTGIETAHIHKVGQLGRLGNAYIFRDSALKTAVVEQITIGMVQFIFANCSHLEVVDIGSIPSLTGNSFISTSPNCKKLVLRSSSILALSDTRFFQGSVFASVGTGGTIYIPKSLYDHLGDGTSLDYKAATNWSTVDGYGTITWAQIEGSAYDGYWADGTPITA